jgi:hypothetical protein
MKATLELPDDLVTEIKLLAVQEGKKLKDAAADLLREGPKAVGAGSAPVVKVDKEDRGSSTTSRGGTGHVRH